MAIFKPTIFQDISGSVGNVTSYKVGKTQIARGKPGFVKGRENPGTIKTTCQIKPDYQIAPPFPQSPIRWLLLPLR